MDGTDAGFYTCTYTGKKLVKEFCSQHTDVPFRLYDMNEVGKYYQTGKQAKQLRHLFSLQERQTDFSQKSFENVVYINLFFTDENTEITVTEDGRKLLVEKVMDSDPMASVFLHSYTVKKKTKRDSVIDKRGWIGHMYRVKTSNANTSLSVTVKTKYGKEYTKNYARPYTFPQFNE